MDLKELGKWLMDVAKYVLTAGIVSTFFHNLKEDWQLYLVGSLVVLSLVCIGMYFIHKSKKQ
ncbi:hypothetical protein FACS1894156_8030 [Bacteroidia bacterium]|nr:hypothetical protein FACS1894156_8030 [Bacteroidia bacterium]